MLKGIVSGGTIPFVVVTQLDTYLFVAYACQKRIQAHMQAELNKMVSELNLTLADNSHEKSHFKLNLAALTGGNYATVTASIAGIVSAIQGVIVGTVQKQELVAERTTLDASFPASALAQRENKWLVQYHDITTQKPGSFTIPTADLDQLVNGTDLMDITTALSPGLLLVAALEANVLSDTGGEIAVDRIKFVGRNL